MALLDMNALLLEGMGAVKELLEGRLVDPNKDAALAIAHAMENLRPNPMMLEQAATDLTRVRNTHGSTVEELLPQTCAWLDRRDAS